MNTIFSQLRADEIEVSFINIIKQCLKHIRFIGIMTIVFAILLPGMVFLLDYKEYNEYQNISNESNEKIENQLTTIEKNAIEEYFVLQEKLVYLDEYKEDSALLKINCNEVYKTTLQFYIRTENENVNNIANAYKSYIQNGGLAEKICEADESLRAQNVYELISNKEREAAFGIVEIRIVSESNAKNEELEVLVENALKEFSKELQGKVETHSIECIQKISSIGYNEDVFEAQKKFYATYNQVSSEIIALEQSFSDLQKIIVYGEEQMEDMNSTEAPSFKIIFLILGSICGFIVGVAFVIVTVILNGKLQSEAELNKRFGYRCINTIYTKPKSMINCFINKNIPELQVQLLETSEKVISRLGDYDSNEVAILSNCSDENHSICQIIKDNLSKKGISAELFYDINNNLDEYEQFKKYKQVMLVSEIANSDIKKIYKEDAICNELKLNIIGYISVSE